MEIRRIEADGYEGVYRAQDDASGLRAFIAVHDTTLGPALGGCRRWAYAGEDDALTDVLRLARGMTYKSAIARTGLGGGKAVLLPPAGRHDRAELFRAMGRFIHALGGRYLTAEDVGTSVEDMHHMRGVTPYVAGHAENAGGSGDPSPFTALGVFEGIRAAAETRLGRSSLDGLTVAVQGLGNVGFRVARHLRDAGARLVVTDVHEERVVEAVRELGAQAVGPEEIYDVACEVFSPNALGATLNDDTLPRLRCAVVGGGANNQLAEERHGEALRARGILYAPDFVINAGGIINVSMEFAPGGYDADIARTRTCAIHNTLRGIFAASAQAGVATSVAAVRMAEEILTAARVPQAS